MLCSPDSIGLSLTLPLDIVRWIVCPLVVLSCSSEGLWTYYEDEKIVVHGEELHLKRVYVRKLPMSYYGRKSRGTEDIVDLAASVWVSHTYFEYRKVYFVWGRRHRHRIRGLDIERGVRCLHDLQYALFHDLESKASLSVRWIRIQYQRITALNQTFVSISDRAAILSAIDALQTANWSTFSRYLFHSMPPSSLFHKHNKLA